MKLTIRHDVDMHGRVYWQFLLDGWRTRLLLLNVAEESARTPWMLMYKHRAVMTAGGRPVCFPCVEAAMRVVSRELDVYLGKESEWLKPIKAKTTADAISLN